MFYAYWLAVAAPLIVSLFLWAYTRLTCGKCRCDRTRVAGQTIVVTGGNRDGEISVNETGDYQIERAKHFLRNPGIGRCCVEQLCQGGARVIIGCRNTKQGDQVIAECQRKQYPGSVEVFELDLQYFSSVRTFVERIKTLNRTIDVLVNNAGVGVPEKLVDTQDGFEVTYQTNYLGPMLLTHLLLPYLRRPGRIVNVSSMQYQMGSNRRLCKNQQCSIHTPLFGSFVYGDAKLALNYWTRTLAHKLRSTSITVHSCHPGFVKTDIFFGHYGNLMHFTLRWLTHIFAKSPSEGAQTTLHLVLSSEAGHLSGLYWADCHVVIPSDYFEDEETARVLWTRSLSQLNLEYF